MDYLKEYYKIIDFRVVNQLEKGLNTEEHHITPKGFFDKCTPKEIINRKENLVYLTNEEHFHVHYYLKEYYKERKKDYKRYYLVALKGFNAMGMKNTSREDLYINAKLFEQGKQELLEIYKQENIVHIKSICEFIKLNGRIPNKRKVYEKSLGYKLADLKKQKKNKPYLFYKDYQDIANSYELFELFDVIDIEKRGLNKISDICDFIDIYNRYPSTYKKYESEIILGYKLDDIKKSKIGKGSTTWFDSYQKFAEERGYPDLFDIMNPEERGINRIYEILEFMKENNREPKFNSKGYEKKLYNKLQTFIVMKGGYGKGLWFDSYQELINKEGYDDLFGDWIK